MKLCIKHIQILICLEIFVIFVLMGYKNIRDNGNTVIMNPDYEVKRIALTFDDGPGEYTEKLIEGLKERNVKATFFMTGENIELYKKLVKRVSEDGHLIGNHSYTHINLTAVPVKDALDEINKTNELIKSITGKMPEYIRPPYGAWNKYLEKEVDMIEVLWDIDPVDWNTNNTAKVTAHIISHAENDYIILLHDIFESSVDSALKVTDILKKDGYEFVTVDEIFGIK